MKTLRLIALVGAMALLSGCAIATLQTANTLPKGDVSITAASFGIGSSSTGVAYSEGAAPQLMLRMGVNENMDIGIQTFALGGYVDLKYALVQDKEGGAALAVIGGLGYSQLGVSILALDAGGIFSIKLGSFLAPYVAAKVRYWGIGAGGSDREFADTFGGKFIIGTFGAQLFPDSPISLIAEVNQFFSMEGNKADLFIVAGGVQLHF